MWISILILALAFQGFIAYDLRSCGVEKCLQAVPEDIVNNPVDFPEVEKLDEICPVVLEAVECTLNLIEDCVGKTVQELAASDDRDVSSAAKMTLSIRRLYTDMCDEQSSFHKDLLQSGSCIKQYGETINIDECYEEALEAYSVYAEFLEANPEEQELRGEDSKSCIIYSFAMACQLLEMKEHCGEASVNVVKRFIKEIKALGHNDICSPEDIPAMKTKFLDSLGLEEEHRNLFSDFIDLKKKK